MTVETGFRSLGNKNPKFFLMKYWVIFLFLIIRFNLFHHKSWGLMWVGYKHQIKPMKEWVPPPSPPIPPLSHSHTLPAKTPRCSTLDPVVQHSWLQSHLFFFFHPLSVCDLQTEERFLKRFQTVLWKKSEVKWKERKVERLGAACEQQS